MVGTVTPSPDTRQASLALLRERTSSAWAAINGRASAFKGRDRGFYGSVGPSEPDDGDGAVGFLLVPGVAWLELRDSLPRLSARVSVELTGGHSHLTAAEFDLDLVRMRGDVVVPGRMMS